MGNENESFDKWVVGVLKIEILSDFIRDQWVTVIQCLAIVKIVIATFATRMKYYTCKPVQCRVDSTFQVRFCRPYQPSAWRLLD